MGESKKDALRVDLKRKLEIEFHGTRVTSDAGLKLCDKSIFEKHNSFFCTSAKKRAKRPKESLHFGIDLIKVAKMRLTSAAEHV